MVLEALAAVGLTSAVVQFVQFTTEVASKSRDLYNSADGTTREYVELEDYVETFRQLSQGLANSTSRAPPLPTLSPEEQSLVQVASRCRDSCREIRSALDGLIGPGKKTRFRSFRHALKIVWGEKKIDGDVRTSYS